MRIWQDVEAQRRFGDILQRSVGRSASQIGPAANILFDDAFMTPEQLKSKRDRERLMIVERATTVRSENPQTADELYQIYNFRHPDNPIINPMAEELKFLKSKQQTQRKRLEFEVGIRR